MCLKEMFLLSFRSLFTDKLTSCNLKIVFALSVRVKAFQPLRRSCLRCSFQDLFTSISLVAAMLPFMVRPDAILKSEFVNNQAFHISLKKVKIENNKLTAIEEHLLCCNCFPSFEDFSILTRDSTDFKLKIRKSLLMTCDKLVLNKVDCSLPLELFCHSIRGYHMMFYPII